MQIPKLPPDSSQPPERRDEILQAVTSPCLPKSGYPHWDKLIRYRPPGDLSHEEWWWALKARRRAFYKKVPLVDKLSRNFQYALVDPIPERLHQIDQGAGGFIRMPDQITNPDTRDQYYVNSLIEEAITSSQLEGAATTRPVAKEMIRTGRRPEDNSERMILNNFLTMQRITGFKKKPLTRDLVFSIHKQVTAGTLKDPSAEGRFRRPDEAVVVDDSYGQVFHEPPPAVELEWRMQAMCDFANGKSPQEFVHPVVRSLILHFWLAYDHPFVDGNGRTARALFYWSMLRHDFWLFEFVSISQVILKGPAKYGRAFLYTETDENDLTYFILYHLEVIRRAIEGLHEYIVKKTEQLKTLERELHGMVELNHRQRALISHALRHPHQTYTIKSHRVSHNVVYETARTDLLDLQRRQLLAARKKGRTWLFNPATGLEKKLQQDLWNARK